MTIDQIISYVNMITSSFSRFNEIFSYRIEELFDGIFKFFGPDSLIGKLLGALFSDVVPNITLIEILFGGALLFFVGWTLFKFIVDSIPVVGS